MKQPTTIKNRYLLAIFIVLAAGLLHTAGPAFSFSRPDNDSWLNPSASLAYFDISDDSDLKKGHEDASYGIYGVVTDDVTGETLPGASIRLKGTFTGVFSDAEGRFVMYLPPGEYVLVVSFVGYQTKELAVFMEIDRQEISVALRPSETVLEEVTIEERRAGDHVDKTSMGVAHLEAKAIARIPAMLGEVDVIRAIQMLPGVQSVGEGSSGFNVRGGGMDQNLILMDEATVYNASHLMGFFSVFNNDVVKDVSLYKGNIPAEYGGRLSSLLNVTMREGDMNSFKGSGGLGSISSRLLLEGPVMKDRVSFIAAGRRSYADLFIPLSRNEEIQGNKLYFYDMNMKVNAVVNDNNRLQLSSYHGRDVFRFGSSDPFTMDWGNTTYTANWNHIINDYWLMNVSGLYTGYSYSMEFEGEDNEGFIWEAGNKDVGVKLDMSWFPNEKHHVKFGLASAFHKFSPGMFRGLGNSVFGEMGSTGSNALSHAVYASNEQTVNDRFSLEYGLRVSAFQNMGAATVYRFDDQYQYVDSTVYAGGEIYNTWYGFEPRLGMRFALNDRSSVKASYNRGFQYLHLASYSDGGNPLDIWLPSSEMVKPQISNQYAVGYFRNTSLQNQVLETSLEVYYKSMDNQIDFKDNAFLMLNPRIEGEFRFGKAWAYGVEFLVRKDEGRFNGWVSYTWSRTKRQVEEINHGNPYPASYDRPHNFNLVTNYEWSPRVTLSATWVYSSGTPVTLPSGRFEYGNQVSPVYTGRNAYRLPDYHRLDIGATIKGRKIQGRRYHGEWNISVYNAYYRKNTWMLDFRADVEQPEKLDAYKVYLFPIIPSVTYNFYF